MKRGRKPKPYITSEGEVIPGLRRRKHDDRWILSDGRTFKEPDERRAVNRARSLLGSLPSSAEMVSEFKAAIFWRQVAAMIRDRPEYVAKMTGIPEIARLADLPVPEVLPKLSELETLWRKHYNKSAEQKRKVLRAWKDFTTTAQIGGIKDITPQAVIEYRDAVHARAMTGKTQQNLFTRIRRFISFAKSRAIAVVALSKVIATLSLLTASESATNLNPMPIEVADWKELLKAALGDDRAMILLAMNAAMYLQEVVRLRWDDIRNGSIVTNRAKTGKCIRVAPLWPETLDALANVKRKGNHIFYAYDGSPLGIKGAEKRFRKLRKAAGVNVTSSQLRDGAYTTAVEAGVSDTLCRLLTGHRAAGVQDNYVMRRPRMVQPATDAIHSAYMS